MQRNNEKLFLYSFLFHINQFDEVDKDFKLIMEKSFYNFFQVTIAKGSV